MQNGTAFRAFIEETAEFLEGISVIDYYGRPLPAPEDERFAEIIARFTAANAVERAHFLEALTSQQRALFGIFGHRAATLAVREAAPVLLQQGLVGAAVANYEIPEKRQVEVALAVYYHCAQKLDLNPADVFARAADYAAPDFAYRLITFGNRGDVTLRKFGWRELHTPQGVSYKFEWR